MGWVNKNGKNSKLKNRRIIKAYIILSELDTRGKIEKW
jgi:hypothetical protein